MVNPRTLLTTNSFSIQFTTAVSNKQCPIAALSTGIVVTMLSVPTITSVSLTQSSGVNGASPTYTFTVVPGLSLQNNDIFQLTFPSETTVPTNPSCTAGNSLSSAVCTLLSPNVVRVRLMFQSSSLPSTGSFTFAIANVKNPPSTKPSSSFSSISLSDSGSNQVASYSGSLTVTNIQFATATGSLFQYNNEVSQPSEYYITYTTANPMAAKATFKINVPLTVGTPSTFEDCYVKVPGEYKMSCSKTCTSTTCVISMITGSNQGIPTALP